MKQFFISVFIFLILLLPVFSAVAYDPLKGLIPCSNTTEVKEGSATPKGECDFYAFMKLVDNVIKFLLYYMAVPIAAIMFAYAGFLMVTAGEEAASARTKAKGIFTNALFGLVLAAACWLIVKAILDILGYKGEWIGF